MKTMSCEFELLEERISPALLLSPVDPALRLSPVEEFASSPTTLSALALNPVPGLPSVNATGVAPVLTPIAGASLIDLLQPGFLASPFIQIGSVIPPMNAPGSLLSGFDYTGGGLLFGSFR